jgi:hypothetical protein
VIPSDIAACVAAYLMIGAFTFVGTGWFMDQKVRATEPEADVKVAVLAGTLWPLVAPFLAVVIAYLWARTSAQGVAIIWRLLRPKRAELPAAKVVQR